MARVHRDTGPNWVHSETCHDRVACHQLVSKPQPPQPPQPRDEVHGSVPGEAPPQAAGAQYFCMGDVEEVPAAERPTPLLEVWPQVWEERLQLVLDVTVPQMGRELVEAPMITFVEQIVGIPARGGGRFRAMWHGLTRHVSSTTAQPPPRQPQQQQLRVTSRGSGQ